MAFDLDDEELEATRKMHKGSNINVDSIDKAIEILENAIRCNEKQFEELGTHILLQDDEQEAIKIVLANLEILCDMQRTADKELKNSIPKQVIKNKIEKLKNELKFIACFKDCNKCFDEKGKVLYRGSDFIPCYAYHQIKILQELLEDK